jgi:hypothetical protein
MVVEASEKKLREARFFLEKLRGARVSEPSEGEAFDFYLSAFLSAGRAVTFVLHKEQSGVYAQLRDRWLERLTSDEKDLLAYLRDQRNSGQKQGSSDAAAAMEFVPTPPGPIDPDLFKFGSGWSGEATNGLPSHYGRAVDYFILPSGNVANIINACTIYILLLDALVRDFIET